jgi:bifunctional UDP-N-acetylglucosamine pyrophosphorylase / glucosamine-1-phosphate N-acetyltransferase
MHSDTPKLLHPLCGRPLIAWSVAAARDAGAAKIVVVQAPERPLDAVLDDGVVVAVQENALGTADAVRSASDQFRGAGTVIVCNGDHPLVGADTLRDLAEAHEHSGAAATIVTAVLDDPTGYGRVIRGPDGTVERVAETKAPGDASEHELQIREVNTGIIAFEAEELVTALEQVGTGNVQGEMYLPDVLPILRSHERTVLTFEAPDVAPALGVNDRAQLALVRARAQESINRRHMVAGVTVVDPNTTVIDVGVEIEPDVVIHPFSSLLGDTRVESGASVGPLSTLIDCEVGSGANVVHSFAKNAEIGERVSVGPFANLRPGTVLCAGSKAGTFVEIKNSTIGAGTKVPHLSYIGDADVGEDTNLGATTITANYDGARKHRTTIGDRVKTSVDTTLVAPVTVGDDAYTGAGSVITKDVPAGALGIARERQRNIDGYADRRREQDDGVGADGKGDTHGGAPDREPSRLAPDINSGAG